MYEVHDATSAMACYSDAKDFFIDAIGMRRRLGDADGVARLEARLAHIKAVYRSQFS